MVTKNNYKSYLEIGCNKDDLFSKVSIEKKVGVDPNEGGNVRLTSDSFFNINTDTFDIIFIDGLHVYEQVKRDVMSVVTRHFRPEFINRIDETVVFHPLAAAQIRNIANIQVASLNKRLQYNDLSIEVSEAVLDKIAALGYDPVYGARPLRRAVQNWIENPLAQRVIRGDYNPGDRIVVDVSDEGFEFSKREAGSFQP